MQRAEVKHREAGEKRKGKLGLTETSERAEQEEALAVKYSFVYLQLQLNVLVFPVDVLETCIKYFQNYTKYILCHTDIK